MACRAVMDNLHPAEQDEVGDLLLSALYRQAADELPPPQLDQAVRQQARKVVRRRNWLAPSGLVLALGALAVVVGSGAFLGGPSVQRPLQSGKPLVSDPQGTPPSGLEQGRRTRVELKMRERAGRPGERGAQAVCQSDLPPVDAGAMEWLRRIRDLRQSGAQARALCLQGRFRQRFSWPGQGTSLPAREGDKALPNPG